MFEQSALPAPARAGVSTAAIFGQVMFLVAVAIGFLTLGSYLGRDLTSGTALACSIGGFVMLMVHNFGGARFRVGSFAIGWLCATAALIGLGLGPVLASYLAADPAVVTQAAAGTALITLGMGALGMAISKDLAPWMRPVSLIVFGAVVVSFVMALFFSGGNPILSIVIAGFSALLLVIDFNYVRKHADEDDVVWLATGIFVSILNIFLSLLNLFSRD